MQPSYSKIAKFASTITLAKVMNFMTYVMTQWWAEVQVIYTTWAAAVKMIRHVGPFVLQCSPH